MAVVTWPLSSGEARGRVGGLIYNTHRGTTYVKTHAVHQSEFTTPQITARVNTANLTIEWHDLSAVNRSNWDDFAERHTLPHWSGQPKRLSGYNWFIRLNWLTAFSGYAPFYAPPTYLAGYLFINLTAHYTAPDIEITWTPQTDTGNTSYFVITRYEGPYPGPRTPNIKRAGRLHLTYEHQFGIAWTPPAPGSWYAHVYLNGYHTGPIAHTHFAVEVT